MRILFGIMVTIAAIIGHRTDGYDRTDLVFGILFGLLLTWMMGYKLPKD